MRRGDVYMNGVSYTLRNSIPKIAPFHDLESDGRSLRRGNSGEDPNSDPLRIEGLDDGEPISQAIPKRREHDRKPHSCIAKRPLN
jgi:hypothetical protein